MIKGKAIVVAVRKEGQGGDSLQEGNFEKDASAANGKWRQNLTHALHWSPFLKSGCFGKMVGLAHHLFSRQGSWYSELHAIIKHRHFDKIALYFQLRVLVMTMQITPVLLVDL